MTSAHVFKPLNNCEYVKGSGSDVVNCGRKLLKIPLNNVKIS